MRMKKTALGALAAVLIFCLLLLFGCAANTRSAESVLTADSETAPVSTETGTDTPETETVPAETETESEEAGTEPPETESVSEGTEYVAPPTEYSAPETTAAPQTAAPSTTAAPAPEPTPVQTPVPPKNPNDTEPPFFLHFNYSLTFERGATIDLHKYISYIDDLDSDVELTVKGAVDTGKIGTYPLTLTLTDDSGNSTSRDMTVYIVEPTPSGTSDGSYIYTPPPARSFSDFAASYKKDGTSIGIDVSRWQGEIDFGKVAAAGCEFVIIRIGGYADGVFEDPYYAENIKKAKAAGLKVGVYWYSEENGPTKVRANSAYLYSLLGDEKLDFPIFFDWEDYINLEKYKMSLKDLNDMFLAFKDEALAHGYNAALYNSAYYLGVLWSDAVKGNGVWLAHYTDQTDYDGRYFLWQQGFGRIDGIDGEVDVDVLYPDVMKTFS